MLERLEKVENDEGRKRFVIFNSEETSPPLMNIAKWHSHYIIQFSILDKPKQHKIQKILDSLIFVPYILSAVKQKEMNIKT